MNVKRTNNTTKNLSSRLLALILTLAMVIGVMPTAFAASNGDATFGNVAFKDSDNLAVQEIKTIDGFKLAIQAMYGNTDAGVQKPRVYLKSNVDGVYDCTDFAIYDGHTTEIDGVKYTVHASDNANLGQFYIEIDQLAAGQVASVGFSFRFNTNAKDGDTLTATICDMDGNILSSNNSHSPQVTIKALESADLYNTISADPKTESIDQNATTLAGKDITWTIKENIPDHDKSMDNNGVARITGYEATSVIKLPDGMTVDSAYRGELTPAQAAELLPLLPSSTEVDQNKTKVTVSDDGKTITVNWTATNPSQTSFNEQTETIKLNGSKVNVDSSMKVGNISNTVTTDFTTETRNGVAHHTTTPATDTTTIARDGSDIAAANKKVSGFQIVENQWYAGGRIYMDSNGHVAGYVVEDDLILFSIPIENGTGSEKTYTVTDVLSDCNLMFERLDGTDAGITVTEGSQGSGRVVFSVTVPRATTSGNTQVNGQKTLRFYARVDKSISELKTAGTITNDKDTYIITNKATVACNDSSLTVTAEDVPEKEAAPKLSITKTSTLPNNVFSDSSEFYYNIKISNGGTAAANGIAVADLLPDGILLRDGTISCTPSEGATSSQFTVENKNITGTVNLPINGSVNVSIPVKIDSTAGLSLITNTATETYNGETIPADVTITKNTSTVGSIEVTKKADKNIVNTGDEVTYTITLKNPNAGALENKTFWLVDYLPEGLSFVSYDASGVNGTVTQDYTSDGKIKFNLVNTTIAGNGTAVIVVKAMVESITANTTAVNQATIFTDSTLAHPGLSGQDGGIVHPENVEEPTFDVEKKMYQADTNSNYYTGYGAEIADNSAVDNATKVTYRIKITNTSDVPMTDFTLKDFFTGTFDEEGQRVYISEIGEGTTYNGSNTVPANWYDQGAQLISNMNIGGCSGAYFDIKFQNTAEASAYEFSSASGCYRAIVKGLSIAPNGGYAVISYTLKTAQDWAGNPPRWNGASNTALVTCNDKTDSDTATLTKKGSTTPDNPGEHEDPETPQSKLEMTKTASTPKNTDTSKKSITVSENLGTDGAVSDIKNRGKFLYTIVLTNNSNEDYTTTDAEFSDLIPAGFGLDLVWDGINDSIYTVKVEGQDGNKTDAYPYTAKLITTEASGSTSESSVDLSTNSRKAVQTNENLTTSCSYYAKGMEHMHLTTGEVVIHAWQASNKGYPVSWNHSYVILNEDGTCGAEIDGDVGSCPQTVYKTDYLVLEGTRFVVSFANLTIPAGKTVTITYTLAPTAAEVEGTQTGEGVRTSFKSEMGKNSSAVFDDRTYKNEMTFAVNEETGTKFETSEGKNKTSVTAVEHTKILSEKIHPGISKTPSGYIERDATGSNIAHEYKGEYVNPLSYLIWKVRVTNGTDDAGGGAAMSGFSVVDTYPDTYNFVGPTVTTSQGASYTARVWINDQEQIGYYPNVSNSETGTNDTFTFDGKTLNPGDSIEFEVITEPTKNVHGIYKNSVKLKVGDKELYADAVVSGDASDDGVTTDGYFPLNQVGTMGTKTVYKHSDHNVKASSTDSGSRKIETDPNDIVDYELVVDNYGSQESSSSGVLENFAVIDRLPSASETEKGVITEGLRNSTVSMKYYEDDEIKPWARVDFKDGTFVTLDETYIDKMFSSDTTHVFEPADVDWGAGIENGAVTWTHDYNDSTSLIRFALKNLDKHPDAAKFQGSYKPVDAGLNGESITVYGIPSGAKVTIGFSAKVPFVENAGESAIAWNSFAYYFNSGEFENMVAEPAKVGNYVNDSTYGGAILVRKRYQSNAPAQTKTFHFAIYDNKIEDGGNKLDELTITLNGTEKGYAQADSYFTNLKVPASGNKSYYIYECDASGNPIIADSISTDFKSKEAHYIDNGRNFAFTFNNEAQEALKETNQRDTYNSNYLVWKKDLSKDKKINSAIFTNEYHMEVETEVYGPFYADVPTNVGASASADKMLSSRPGANGVEYDPKAEMQEQKSNERTSTFSGYGNGTVYDHVNRFGGDQDHTIATGFLAKLQGLGPFTVNKVTWTVTFNSDTYPDKTNPNNKLQRSSDTIDPGVYVRLKTANLSGAEDEEVTVFNLTEYMAEIGYVPAETKTESYGDIAAEDAAEAMESDEEMSFDGEEAESDVVGDIMYSGYTKEEAEELFALEYGLDPDNMIRNDFGEALFVINKDGELMDSESASTALGNVTEKITSANLTDSGFTDKTDKDGYTIYKLVSGTPYQTTLIDSFPNITLDETTEVYVGMVIDQLYDRHAIGDIKVSSDREYLDDTVDKSAVNAPLKHTKVTSPLPHNYDSANKFEKPGKTVYKLSNETVTFDELEKKEYKEDIVDDYFMVIATSNKPVKVSGSNVIDGATQKLSLSGQGTDDHAYRTLVLNVAAGKKVTIYATSGNGTRNLVVDYKNGNTWESKTDIVPPTTDGAATFDYANNASFIVSESGPIYIYSANGGIDIYKIVVGD